jgi:hypothetical protein
MWERRAEDVNRIANGEQTERFDRILNPQSNTSVGCLRADGLGLLGAMDSQLDSPLFVSGMEKSQPTSGNTWRASRTIVHIKHPELTGWRGGTCPTDRNRVGREYAIPLRDNHDAVGKAYEYFSARDSPGYRLSRLSWRGVWRLSMAPAVAPTAAPLRAFPDTAPAAAGVALLWMFSWCACAGVRIDGCVTGASAGCVCAH